MLLSDLLNHEILRGTEVTIVCRPEQNSLLPTQSLGTGYSTAKVDGQQQQQEADDSGQQKKSDRPSKSPQDSFSQSDSQPSTSVDKNQKRLKGDQACSCTADNQCTFKRVVPQELTSGLIHPQSQPAGDTPAQTMQVTYSLSSDQLDASVRFHCQCCLDQINQGKCNSLHMAASDHSSKRGHT